MSLSNQTKNLITEKIQKLKQYAYWSSDSKKPPSGYGDCLTYLLSIEHQLNIEPIIDDLLGLLLIAQIMLMDVCYLSFLSRKA